MVWISDMWGDVCFAARQLRRAPGFALVAVITLALGIGVNTAIFALVDATLLRPLPFPDADRLVMIWSTSESSQRHPVSPTDLLDFTERSTSFDGITAYFPGVGGMVMASPDGSTEDVPRQWLPSANIFEVLGIRAVVGRTFLASDETSEARVIVLSEAFWRSRFNADPAVVGRSLRLDGMPFTVVGVVPPSARLIGDASVWALRPIPPNPAFRGQRALLAIGRMTRGSSREAASSDLGRISAALAQEYADTNSGRGVRLEPLRDALVGRDLRITAVLFLAVVAFVLLICCANVASLQIARATTRARELSLRATLGASRGRIARQLLTESLLLAVLGGAAGLVIGAVILAAAPALIPPDLLPGAITLTLDARVLTFCAGASLAVGVLFGLAPARQAATATAGDLQATDSRTSTSAGRMRHVFVAGELATAVVLLCAAGLLLRTLVTVNSVDSGFDTAGVLTMMVDPMGSSYPSATALQNFYDEVEQQVRALPGVANVAWSTAVPLGGSQIGDVAFNVVGSALPNPNAHPTAGYQIVSGTYFETVGVPILAGRGFTGFDRRDNVPVCIVSEALAQRHLGGIHAIGSRILLRPAEASRTAAVVHEVVGIVRQVKGRPDEIEDRLQVYVPITQQITDDMYLFVRAASGEASALGGGIRGAIARVDRAQLVGVRNVRTLDEVGWAAASRYRFRAVLVLTFAALSLTLAMVGVFGTVAYTVQQRVREFGIRMALGASAGGVFALVLGGAARVVISGIAIGLVLAAAAARVLENLLFGVRPLDAVTFTLVAAILLATSLAATAVPAWRATRVDPMLTLREP